MQPSAPRSSFDTTRTYPVGADEVRRAVETVVSGLPGWEAGRSSGGEVTAARRSWLGFRDDICVRLTERQTDAHTNTHATFRSTSRKGAYDFGQNKRNVRELLDALDGEIRAGSLSGRK